MEPFSPLDPRLTVDPYPLYAELRKAEPIHMSAMGAYVLTRYEDVKQMLTDNQTFQHQYVTQQKARAGDAVLQESYFDYFRRMIFVLDDPDHRRIRKLVHKAFTPKRVRELRERTIYIVNDLIDRKSDVREMDFIAEFAYPFPIKVIGSILGMPEEDHERIGAYATALNPVLEFLPMGAEVLAKANNAVEELVEYFTVLATKRRAEPTDDLFSALVHASEDDESLSNKELIANAILLYVAGHETTAGGTGLALLSLHRNRRQLERLKTDPQRLSNAVEELLRYDTPGQGTARVVTSDTRFGDTTISAGSMVLGYIGAANRDPDAYSKPDQLDIARDFNVQPRPLTWGGGAHLCLGRLLALQEIEAALEVFLSRCPHFEICCDQPEFRPTPLMRGLANLPIRW